MTGITSGQLRTLADEIDAAKLDFLRMVLLQDGRSALVQTDNGQFTRLFKHDPESGKLKACAVEIDKV